MGFDDHCCDRCGLPLDLETMQCATPGCAGEGTIWEAFAERKAERQREGEIRRTAENCDWGNNRDLAQSFGMRLIRHSAAHYQLEGPRDRGNPGLKPWLVNIYPGNQRLFADPHRRPPFLNVQRPWTIADCIRAAAEAQSKARR